MAVVREIGIFAQKKAPKELLQNARFIPGGGIEGDFHANDGERAISMMGVETKQKMEDEQLKGLCTSKFSTNLMTEGVELQSLCVGDIVQIGEVEIEITQVGKECFAECQMTDRSKCPLKAECAFGFTLAGGTARPGDAMQVKRKAE